MLSFVVTFSAVAGTGAVAWLILKKTQQARRIYRFHDDA